MQSMVDDANMPSCISILSTHASEACLALAAEAGPNLHHDPDKNSDDASVTSGCSAAVGSKLCLESGHSCHG